MIKIISKTWEMCLVLQALSQSLENIKKGFLAVGKITVCLVTRSFVEVIIH